MKKIAYVLLFLVALVSSASAQAGEAVKGAIWTAQQQVTWGPGIVNYGKTLLVLNTTFKRDSGGGYVAFDTAAYGSAGQGACSNEIMLQQTGGVQPEKMVLVAYKARASDITQGTATMRLRGSWTDPVGAGTDWVDSSYLWDSTLVILTHHIRGLATANQTRDARFGMNSTKAKVCIQRGNVGPGDTIYIQNVWIRPI